MDSDDSCDSVFPFLPSKIKSANDMPSRPRPIGGNSIEAVLSRHFCWPFQDDDQPDYGIGSISGQSTSSRVYHSANKVKASDLDYKSEAGNFSNDNSSSTGRKYRQRKRRTGIVKKTTLPPLLQAKVDAACGRWVDGTIVAKKGKIVGWEGLQQIADSKTRYTPYHSTPKRKTIDPGPFAIPRDPFGRRPNMTVQSQPHDFRLGHALDAKRVGIPGKRGLEEILNKPNTLGKVKVPPRKYRAELNGQKCNFKWGGIEHASGRPWRRVSSFRKANGRKVWKFVDN